MNDAVRPPLDSDAGGGLLSPGPENNWCAQDVADALGGDVDDLGVLAPKPGHSDADRSMRVMVGDQFPDGYWVGSAFANEGEDWRALRTFVERQCPFLLESGVEPVTLTNEERAARAAAKAARDAQREAKDASKRRYYLEMWEGAKPVEETPNLLVHTYLKGRGIEPPPGVLRSAYLRYKDAWASAMMAEVVSPTTDERLGFHLTFLGAGGRKVKWGGAERITPKLTSDRKAVGVVKLIACVGKAERSLCIGEGIETALSFAHLPKAKGATIWAGVNSANMAQLPALDDFDAIMIAVDIEPSGAGERAARELAARWAQAGKRARLFYPIPPEGAKKFDLNDVVQIDGSPVEGVHYRIERFEAGPNAHSGNGADPRSSAGADNRAASKPNVDDGSTRGGTAKNDKAQCADDDGEKPVIQISGGDLDRIATQGEQALLASRVQLFQRANELVRPVVSEVDAARGRRTKVAQLIRVEPPYLRDILCRVAGWSKWNARAKNFVAIDPPPEIAATILARAGEWGFRTITGIISTQTMRPDGTILDREGYDEATGLLLVAPPEMPPIPDAPSLDHALAALAILKRLLDEFPFVGDVDRAVALSALITPVVRGAFPVAPMHCAKAPVAGSGKSYLFDVAGAIAIGQIMPVMAAGANEEELEKRLGAALLAGQPLICIDNVNGELKGDALCQTIERPLVEIRILGKSERVRIQARATTTFCTGNNIIIVGDLCRRVIATNLDPMMESPETRAFKSNQVELVLANRGAYVAAALTICRAYAVAGKPEAKRVGSFEGWSDTVGSALIWLGEPDVVDSMAVAKTDDPELAELNEMLSSWAEVLGVGCRYRLPTAEVIKIIGERQQESSLLSPSSWPRLNAAIQAAASIGREPADAKRLGLWLRNRKGRLVGRYRFMNNSDKNRMQTSWWVDDLDGVETEGLRRGRSHSSASDPITDDTTVYACNIPIVSSSFARGLGRPSDIQNGNIRGKGNEMEGHCMVMIAIIAMFPALSPNMSLHTKLQ